MDIKKIIEDLYNAEEDSVNYRLILEKLNQKYIGDKDHLKKSIRECKKTSTSITGFRSCIRQKLKLGYQPPEYDCT